MIFREVEFENILIFLNLFRVTQDKPQGLKYIYYRAYCFGRKIYFINQQRKTIQILTKSREKLHQEYNNEERREEKKL